ncbi:twin-arginine translocase TatA/TatE family subunit [Pacificimonas flava]|uniref:Sec-independent protein translocase protein TatA n=1 Tax=Pacificimonas flava TaxID=1234595 RepID=M2U5B2_9SPHN|nr:twin-arginine translocase TatA/TatE family subunit [Pacificimonas flava]EMD83188.1 Twin-arginine translocation protein TatA [Pacificimonas flava]MBB5279247.1 sec-independent protein translocase protein TatA [Pacificimonas flava]
MGSLSIWHWLIVAIVIMLLFGKGRISEMMGDLAKGIKSFKHGLADDEATPESERAMLTREKTPDRSHAPVEPTQATPASSGEQRNS